MRPRPKAVLAAILIMATLTAGQATSTAQGEGSSATSRPSECAGVWPDALNVADALNDAHHTGPSYLLWGAQSERATIIVGDYTSISDGLAATHRVGDLRQARKCRLATLEQGIETARACPPDTLRRVRWHVNHLTPGAEDVRTICEAFTLATPIPATADCRGEQDHIDSVRALADLDRSTDPHTEGANNLGRWWRWETRCMLAHAELRPLSTAWTRENRCTEIAWLGRHSTPGAAEALTRCRATDDPGPLAIRDLARSILSPIGVSLAPLTPAQAARLAELADGIDRWIEQVGSWARTDTATGSESLVPLARVSVPDAWQRIELALGSAHTRQAGIDRLLAGGQSPWDLSESDWALHNRLATGIMYGGWQDPTESRGSIVDGLDAIRGWLATFVPGD